MILVTPYADPDLDGYACAYAYAELLKSQGKEAVGAIFGRPHPEAEFILEECTITGLENGEEAIAESEEIILVDASDTNGISPKIRHEDVIEIIDHRRTHEAERFPNAKVQIELVGAAATLIAERFKAEEKEPSREAAALLYGAIISNTINFQARVTTERDKEMAAWLVSICHPRKDIIKRMFSAKSEIKEPLKEYFPREFAAGNLCGKRSSIAQLEIIDAEAFVRKRKEEIVQALEELKAEHGLDLIFLTCIDIEKGYNTLLAIDDETERILAEILKITFTDHIGKTEDVYMRKELLPLLKEFLEN